MVTSAWLGRGRREGWSTERALSRERRHETARPLRTGSKTSLLEGSRFAAVRFFTSKLIRRTVKRPIGRRDGAMASCHCVAEIAVDLNGPAATNADPPVSPVPTLKKMGSSMVSLAGPDLPVHFSQISIASNSFSYDPWSGGGGVETTHTLTSSSFRQQADKDRSFTASAPPGARPPSNRRMPSATSIMHVDSHEGALDDNDETDCGELRRDTL